MNAPSGKSENQCILKEIKFVELPLKITITPLSMHKTTLGIELAYFSKYSAICLGGNGLIDAMPLRSSFHHYALL